MPRLYTAKLKHMEEAMKNNSDLKGKVKTFLFHILKNGKVFTLKAFMEKFELNWVESMTIIGIVERENELKIKIKED